MNNTVRDGAHSLASLGMWVIPVERESKKPHVVRWQSTGATVDPATIERFWKKWPDANVGVSCGPSNVIVLEVDPRRGGNETIAALLLKYDADFIRTPTVISGSADGEGRHYYFKVEGRRYKTNYDRLGPGIEVKAVGGQVVAPPSVHASGNAYRWESGYGLDNCPMRTLPDWLVALLEPAPPEHPAQSRGRKVTGDGVVQVGDFPTCTTIPPLTEVTEDALKGLDRDEGFVIAVARGCGVPDHVRVGDMFRCILPGHTEEKPSANLFRTRDGTIVYCDWHHAAHGSPKFLTMAELYAAMVSQRVQKLKKPQHAAWKLRLLVELRLLTLAEVTLRPLPDDASRSVRTLYEGIRLLLGCKWRYTPNEPTPLAHEFMADWCGLSEGSVGEGLKNLYRREIIEKAGSYASPFGPATLHMPCPLRPGDAPAMLIDVLSAEAGLASLPSPPRRLAPLPRQVAQEYIEALKRKVERERPRRSKSQ